MPFSKHQTQVAKGVAILLMVYHHVFFDAALSAPFGVVFTPFAQEQGYRLAQLAKVCVFVFIFLAAYGAARATKAMRSSAKPNEIDKRLARYAGKRYVAIMAGFLFIFVLALLAAYATHTLPRGLPNPAGVYGTGFYGFCYMLIDALGLAFISGNPTLNPEWWYMSVAILIVFMMPLFLRWYQKNGIISYFACVILSFWLYRIGGEGVGHLTLLPLGIAFAEGNWFEKIRAWRVLKQDTKISNVCNSGIRILISAILFVCFVNMSTILNGFYFGQQLAAPALIYFCYEGLSAVPLLGKALAFLGKHSMNIYFTHTFILRSFYDVLFSLRHAAASTLVLVAASLLLSVGLEGLKKLVRYDVLTAKVMAWVGGEQSKNTVLE